VVLLGGAAADADRAEQTAAAVDGDAAGDEQQRPLQRGGQGVERPVGLDQVDQVGGRSVELQSGVGLADAGPAGDQDRAVVPAEGEQVPARIQDGDADRDGAASAVVWAAAIKVSASTVVSGVTAVAFTVLLPEAMWRRKGGQWWTGAAAGTLAVVFRVGVRRSRAADQRARTSAAAARAAPTQFGAV
jgi:hypothetical protein